MQEKKPASDSLVYNALLYAAKDHRCAVWNLAAVMGGNESIHWWFAEGLAGKDMIHFTQTGYAFQAQLLVEALMKGYAAFQAEKN
jgi:hypothetical protein